MRFHRHRILSGVAAAVVRHRAVGTMLVAILAAPVALSLYAKDRDKPREKRKDRTAIATKVDESKRLAGIEAAAGHPLSPVLVAASASRDAVRKLPGYTCTFTKQERLKKGTLITQVLSLKFRREPFSVYLKYVDPHAGREVLFVEGRNKGRMHVHETSGLAAVVGTVSLLPTCGEAMKENRYPVTMIGMEKMLETLIAEWESALKHPDVRVEHFPQAKVGETECRMFEIVYPQAREPLRFHKSRVYFDKKTSLPIRTEQYDFPAKAGEEPPLVEEYTYTDVKTDAAPSETDFDVKNGNYGFK